MCPKGWQSVATKSQLHCTHVGHLALLGSEDLADFLLLEDVVSLQHLLPQPVWMRDSGDWVGHLNNNHLWVSPLPNT